MTDSPQLAGKLVALHWPQIASEVTLSDDTNQLQEVTAEIEDNTGVTHMVEVLVKWDADYLIGKVVSTNSTAQGATLSIVS